MEDGSQFNDFNDSFEEPVREPSLEPVREPKQASPSTVRLVKCGTETIKEFVKNNPNSYVIVSARSKGLLRLDTKRRTKYEVMLVPTIRDELNKQLNTNA